MSRTDGRVHSLLLLVLLLGLTQFGCSNNDGSSSPGPGAFQMNASAGAGGSGTGQGGGEVLIASFGRTGALVSNSGAANAGFDIPATVAVARAANLGTLPLTVTDNMTIRYKATLPVPAGDNQYYLGVGTNGVNTLWYQADNAVKRVTGIQVNDAKVLTLEANADTNGNGAADTAQIVLRNDLIVNGTIRTALFDNNSYNVPAGTLEVDDKLSRAGLKIGVYGQIAIGAKGTVTTAGLSNLGVVQGAGHGGAILLQTWSYSKNGGFFVNQGEINASGGSSLDNTGGNAAYYGTSCNSFGDGSITGYDWDFGSCDSVTLEAHGYFVNRGKIIANGGAGDLDAGDAPGSDTVYISALNIYNQPAIPGDNNIQASGGISNKGVGGNGTSVYLDGGNGTYNMGGILANGGNGKTQGGYASYNGIELWGLQTLRNTGNLFANGGKGTQTDNASAISGGQGGGIFLYSKVDLLNSGSLSANGGDCANDNTGGSAGRGGHIEILIDASGSFMGDGGQTFPQNLIASGNFFAKGGSGGNGGSGGDIFVAYGPVSDVFSGSWADNPNYSIGGIQLYGYTDLIANGGNGKAGAGDGGWIAVATVSDAWFQNWDYSGGGFNPRSAAKQPGMFFFEDVPAGGFRMPPGPMQNLANISATGGTSTSGSGGDGGWAFLGTETNGAVQGAAGYAFPNGTAENSGTVTLNAGDGKTNGGYGGHLDISGYISTQHTGNVSMNGGAQIDNSADQGHAGGVWMFASSGPATWSGNVSATGGSSLGLRGGDGGYFDAESLTGTNVAGAFVLSGGNAPVITEKLTGAKAGDGGGVWIDTEKGASALGGTTNVAKGTGGAADTYPPAVDGSVSVDGIAR